MMTGLRILRAPLARVCAVALLAGSAACAENVDRIAVTVGRHVIPESEIVVDLRVSAFLDGNTPDLSGAQKRRAADRMVDQYLVLEDAAATRSPVPSAEETAALLDPIRARYPSDAAFRAALERYGITQSQLQAHLTAGLRMLRYTDQRFRPEVQVTEQDLRDAFAALAAKQPPGSPTPLFDASRDTLGELLINQRILAALDRWLAMVRVETQILYRDAAFQ